MENIDETVDEDVNTERGIKQGWDSTGCGVSRCNLTPSRPHYNNRLALYAKSTRMTMEWDIHSIHTTRDLKTNREGGSEWIVIWISFDPNNEFGIWIDLNSKLENTRWIIWSEINFQYSTLLGVKHWILYMRPAFWTTLDIEQWSFCCCYWTSNVEYNIIVFYIKHQTLNIKLRCRRTMELSDVTDLYKWMMSAKLWVDVDLREIYTSNTGW